MSTYTDKLRLELPDQDDYYNVDVFNKNFENIEEFYNEYKDDYTEFRSDVSSLSTNLAKKSDVGHKHTYNDIQGLSNEFQAMNDILDGKSDKGHEHTTENISDKNGVPLENRLVHFIKYSSISYGNDNGIVTFIITANENINLFNGYEFLIPIRTTGVIGTSLGLYKVVINGITYHCQTNMERTLVHDDVFRFVYYDNAFYF